MNLRQLEAFRAVMLSGSVTQAAAALHISQPAVSKLLADLEYHLGFPLFVRSKGVALTVTPEADVFFHEVERSFAGIAVLKRAAADIRNASTGTLRIAALPALAVSFLPSVITTFRRRHAGVDRDMIIETQYAMTICALVLQGLGCSILNPITAADYVDRGLVVRPFKPEILFDYMLFTPKLRPMSQVAQAFIAVLEEHRAAFLATGRLDLG